MSNEASDKRAPSRPPPSMVDPSPETVKIYDTTLRDGTQREGISLSCDDKLRIAERLDTLGVSFIEAGWPGSNPKDAEFFARARDREWQHASLVAFGSTRRAKIAAEDDPQLQALIDARTKVVTIFGKTSRMHVTDVLRTTPEENLLMIEESIVYLRSQGRRVIYDAEHFFDGYGEDAAYALETLRAAKRGGAEVLVLCDTNGGTFPWRIDLVVHNVRDTIDHPLGIHAHDDTGCGVSNSLAAVMAGARHVQGTINGYGERCGNSNLCAVIPSLEAKMGYRCLPKGQLVHLYEVAHFVAEIANLPPDEHMAYVGRSAFAHKGGVHVAAMRRNPTSYQHIEPAIVGNTSRVVVSELSGRGNVLSKSEELGIATTEHASAAVLEQVKDAEARGFSYEAAEASIALLVQRAAPGYVPPFQVLEYQVVAGRRQGTNPYAEATVKVTVGEKVLHVAADGNGPVSALDGALRKALIPMYPELSRISLANYKVRILDATTGTGATTRVLVDCRDDHTSWSTVGASPNIIEASLSALVDGLEYGLHLAGAKPASSKAAEAA
jgi:2-isopropylmalate synthase